MKKTDRQKVFDMYGGRCAYCGCELQKGWHADHVKNVHRYDKTVGYDEANRQPIKEKTMHYPENDCIENMTPACPSCNLYKGGCDIETFRWKISNSITALSKRDAQYKFGKRFGLISENPKPVVFYFETLTPILTGQCKE